MPLKLYENIVRYVLVFMTPSCKLLNINVCHHCIIVLRQVDWRIFYGHKDKQEAARLEQGKHTHIGMQVQSNTRLVADYNSAGQDRKT